MIHTELIAASQRADAMSKVDGGGRRLQRSEHQAYRVRLPGSSATRMWGLGDAIERATHAIGLRPCGGCTKRVAVLHRWLASRGRRSTWTHGHA
jgi:hypothetical protein